MRTVFPIALLLLCSCDSRPTNPFSQEVTDKSGTNRLILNYVSAGRPDGDTEFFAFHSLAWRTKAGTNWSDRAVITKTDFEAGSLRWRSVTDIYSVDPSTGTAVIKVAEMSPPRTNGSTTVVYSWREWSMTSNAEVRVLRVCKEPSEPLNLSVSYKLRERVINRR